MLAFYAVFLGVHAYGAGEAVRLIFAITAVAVDNLFDIPATDAAEPSAFLPLGYNRRMSQRKSWAI